MQQEQVKLVITFMLRVSAGQGGHIDGDLPSDFDTECSVCVGMKPNAREDLQCSIQIH
jgi:hypothetical protein